jgi:hypothetical protein
LRKLIDDVSGPRREDAENERDKKTSPSSTAAANTEIRPGRRKRLGPRATVIRQAIRDGKTAKGYCKYLSHQGIETPEGWQKESCPKSYVEAYDHKHWKQRIWREKNNEKRRMNRAEKPSP